MTTNEEFSNEFLVKNGMQVNEQNLNAAPLQLKNEVNELDSLIKSIGSLEDFTTSLES